MIGERAYINLVKKIIKKGKMEFGRNGETKVCIGETMRFSLKNNRIPLLTTKKMAWKTCLRELLWFISGNTDNAILQKNNVNIWNGNAMLGGYNNAKKTIWDQFTDFNGGILAINT